ncbi:hypothetical protein MRB53_020785 [Persea americana]|uniref:Uncharacterized protein n=1 Tax=Persea americana TaxID=3435 RepID=A0ACC2L381_PERAE|nr:hypothetical protein MRB53_020785 [Persea americana]
MKIISNYLPLPFSLTHQSHENRVLSPTLPATIAVQETAFLSGISTALSHCARPHSILHLSPNSPAPLIATATHLFNRDELLLAVDLLHDLLLVLVLQIRYPFLFTQLLRVVAGGVCRIVLHGRLEWVKEIPGGSIGRWQRRRGCFLAGRLCSGDRGDDEYEYGGGDPNNPLTLP